MTCPSCRSNNLIQKGSKLTRLLIIVYIFLSIYFFTGEIGYGCLWALVPLLFPYKDFCSNCDKVFNSFIPKWNKGYLNTVEDNLKKYLLAMFPSILIITTLIIYFPHTGLGRIVYLPSIFIINSTILLIYIIQLQKLNKPLNRFLSWAIIILLTIFLTVLLYPQEYGDSVLKIIFSNLLNS